MSAFSTDAECRTDCRVATISQTQGRWKRASHWAVSDKTPPHFSGGVAPPTGGRWDE